MDIQRENILLAQGDRRINNMVYLTARQESLGTSEMEFPLCALATQ